jgi:hypothetical protein
MICFKDEKAIWRTTSVMGFGVGVSGRSEKGEIGNKHKTKWKMGRGGTSNDGSMFVYLASLVFCHRFTMSQILERGVYVH